MTKHIQMASNNAQKAKMYIAILRGSVQKIRPLIAHDIYENIQVLPVLVAVLVLVIMFFLIFIS